MAEGDEMLTLQRLLLVAVIAALLAGCSQPRAGPSPNRGASGAAHLGSDRHAAAGRMVQHPRSGPRARRLPAIMWSCTRMAWPCILNPPAESNSRDNWMPRRWPSGSACSSTRRISCRSRTATRPRRLSPTTIVRYTVLLRDGDTVKTVVAIKSGAPQGLPDYPQRVLELWWMKSRLPVEPVLWLGCMPSAPSLPEVKGQGNVPTTNVLLIHNPAAGPREVEDELDLVVEYLSECGWRVRKCVTEYAGQATECARQAVLDGLDVVLVSGGDGTVCEAVNGLVGSRVALGVLPTGTGNVWAKQLGLPAFTSAQPEPLARGGAPARRGCRACRLTLVARTTGTFCCSPDWDSMHRWRTRWSRASAPPSDLGTIAVPDCSGEWRRSSSMGCAPLSS